MNNYLRLLIFTLISIFVSSNQIITQDSIKLEKIKKNILVNVFPGGRSHNFVLKSLFDHSLDHQKDFEYVYHILVHNTDKNAWPSNGPYQIYGYGNVTFYEQVFSLALEEVQKDPVFGFSQFNYAMKKTLEEFINSGLIQEFSKIKFDMLITDIPNFISVFAREHFNIEHSIYLSPPSLPNVFFNLFELNSGILPAMGSSFFDVMSFKERFINFFYINGMKLIYRVFMDDHVKIFQNYGYNLKNTCAHIYDSFFMVQYPVGLFFNIALPPNVVKLNAITPRPSKPIKDTDTRIDEFLNIHKKNIYFSQGTIVKIIDFKAILGVFNHVPECGFVMAFNKNLISEELFKELPKNILLIDWVNQNDLLGDNRLHAFITHGGTNSVSESLYHDKPMVILGVTLDQINTAAAANKRKVGVVYHKLEEITAENLILGLEQILKPEEENIYLQNAKKIGKIIRSNRDAREEYTYWIDYFFRLGYKHLLVKSYIEYYGFQVINYDVLAVMILILIAFIIIIKKLLVCIFCSCKATKNKVRHG